NIYRLYNATNNLGLLITEGPHHDTQDLQLPVFRWFNRHLKGEDPVIEMAAVPFFRQRELRVFDTLPADERTSKIHETFVSVAATPAVPDSKSAWTNQCQAWKTALQEHVFGGWPSSTLPLALRSRTEAGAEEVLEVYDFDSEHDVPLRLYLLHSTRP